MKDKNKRKSNHCKLWRRK